MQILKAKETVENLLKSRPELRDDDRALIAEVYRQAAAHKYGEDLRRISAEAFLADYANGSFPSAESIRRSRAKLQEHNTDLRGEKYEERKGGRERSARQEIREATPGGEAPKRKSFQERLQEEQEKRVSEAARTLSKAGKDQLRIREAMNPGDQGVGQTSLFHNPGDNGEE